MSNRASELNDAGSCSFCRQQMNLDASLGSRSRGGVFAPPGGSTPVRLCTSCVAGDAIAQLYAGAVLDSGLDAATAAAGLSAAVNSKLGLE